jgi:arylsulfatase
MKRNVKHILIIVNFVAIALLMFGATVKSSSLFGNAHAQSQTSERPNILLIIGDDFGFSDIGSFGSEISTPNLDSLANEGKILTNYHTNPACSPARLALLTGVDNHIGGIGSMSERLASNQVGKPGYEGYINERVVTVAELLRDSGYHTLMAGKWHLSGTQVVNGTTPFDRGFEEVFTLVSSGGQHFNSNPYYAEGHPVFMHNDKVVQRDNKTYSNDLYADTTIDQIKKFDGDGKPLFIYLAFQVAHSPFQAPQEFINKYEEIYKVGYDKIREQRFEKQKQLGIWPAEMKLPQRIPVGETWDSLSPDEKEYRAKVLAVHAAMIDNMDSNIGKVIKYLKDIGEYDKTIIIFASDNAGSEPVDMNTFAGQAATKEQTQKFLAGFNNSIPNVGNANSLVNYGAWGSVPSVSPLSYFKLSQGEGGIRSPFIIKLPNSEVKSSPEILRAYVNVRDITPTLLDYTGVEHPSTFNGREVHPVMGKSLKPLIEGTVDRIYTADEAVSQELFNSTSVFMGDWKALNIITPISDGKWHLFNITSDVGENNDLSMQHPEILQTMIEAYNKYAKDVGVVVPSESPIRSEKTANDGLAVD